MPQIHPLPSHRPCGAMGKSKKCDFCFCKKLFDGAHSPLFRKAAGLRQIGGAKQGSRKSQRSEIFGKRSTGSAHASFAPWGKVRTQPTAPTKKRGFRTRRKLLKEKS